MDKFFAWLARVRLSLVVAGLIGTLGLHVVPAKADPQRRVALVVGNGSYRSAPFLPNPVSDAKAVSAAFKRLGFEVTDGYDLTIEQMRTTIATFAATLPDAKAAVVYYAGHGVSVDGENYLLPVDIVLKSPTDLDLQAIDVSLVLKQLKREERANVIILDACRDNPFAGELANARTRAVIGNRGLSRVDNDLAKGTLIAFASDPNSTALDGRAGDGSPFTKALLNHLEDPDVPIDTVMSRVRSQVWDETRNAQMPWVNTSLIGELILNPQSVAASPPGPAPAPAEQMSRAQPMAPEPDRFALQNRLWDSAEHGNSVDDYRAYLEAYPSGLYAPMARSRIARLTPPEEKPAEAPPAAVMPDPATAALKAEVGTEQTETSLGLDLGRRRELQARLTALAFDAGGVSGTLGEKTRAAIIGWQKNHGVQPTGWLGPLQYAALTRETDASYRQFMSTAPDAPRSPRQAARVRSYPRYEARPRHYQSYRPEYAYRRPRGTSAPASGGMDPAAAAALGGIMGGLIGHFR